MAEIFRNKLKFCFFLVFRFSTLCWTILDYIFHFGWLIRLRGNQYARQISMTFFTQLFRCFYASCNLVLLLWITKLTRMNSRDFIITKVSRQYVIFSTGQFLLVSILSIFSPSISPVTLVSCLKQALNWKLQFFLIYIWRSRKEEEEWMQMCIRLITIIMWKKVAMANCSIIMELEEHFTVGIKFRKF